MNGLMVALGALNAGLAVGAGAFGAHALRENLEPRAMEIFETAARYQMYHALAVVLCGVIATKGATTAGALFQAGIVLFSGSLYVLVFSGIKALGAVTPLGGLAFLIGWGWLAWSAFSTKAAQG